MITDPLLAKLVQVAYALLLVALISPAAYRVTRLVTQDVVTERPRKWLESHLPGKLDYGLTCPWCAGTWTTAIFFIILYQFIWIPFLPIVFLSTLTIVGFLGNAD